MRRTVKIASAAVLAIPLSLGLSGVAGADGRDRSNNGDVLGLDLSGDRDDDGLLGLNLLGGDRENRNDRDRDGLLGGILGFDDRDRDRDDRDRDRDRGDRFDDDDFPFDGDDD